MNAIGEQIKPFGYGKLQLIDFLYYCIKFDQSENLIDYFLNANIFKKLIV